MAPGQTQLTRIPCFAFSSAAERFGSGAPCQSSSGFSNQLPGQIVSLGRLCCQRFHHRIILNQAASGMLDSLQRDIPVRGCGASGLRIKNDHALRSPFFKHAVRSISLPSSTRRMRRRRRSRVPYRFGPRDGGGFSLAVKMRVEDKSLPQADLAALTQEAHEKICPYSHATRSNVAVELEVVGA